VEDERRAGVSGEGALHGAVCVSVRAHKVVFRMNIIRDIKLLFMKN